METDLELARAGDAEAFATLVAPHRRELLVHCYRMLGSLTEADDLVQEVLHAAWRNLAGFEQRASVRTWLYRIATNRCLNARRDDARRRRGVVEVPFELPTPSRQVDDPVLQPFPDVLLPVRDGPADAAVARADIELAFVAALQRLPGRQVAALVLHDVVGFDRAEVAGLLDTTPTSVKALLQRARAALARTRDATAPPPPAGSDAERAVVGRFATALLDGDVEALVALLTSDAVLAMPPLPHEYVGPGAVASFLAASRRWLPDRRVELRPLRANTQPAFVHVLEDATTGTSASVGVVVLTLAGDRISRITRFLDPEVAAYLAHTTTAPRAR